MVVVIWATVGMFAGTCGVTLAGQGDTASCTWPGLGQYVVSCAGSYLGCRSAGGLSMWMNFSFSIAVIGLFPERNLVSGSIPGWHGAVILFE